MLTESHKLTSSELQEDSLPCKSVHPCLGRAQRSGFHLTHPAVHNPQTLLKEKKKIDSLQSNKGNSSFLSLQFSKTRIFYYVSESKISGTMDQWLKMVPGGFFLKRRIISAFFVLIFSGYESCPIDASQMERGTVILLFPGIQALLHLSQE